MDKYILLKTYIEKMIARCDNEQFSDEEMKAVDHVISLLTLIISTIESVGKSSK